jgi:hypothetical protein
VHNNENALLHHADPLEEELVLPLYPKNVSEETLRELKRLKRQHYYDDPYLAAAAPQSQPQFYVTADGSDYRDDGRGDEWSGPTPCSRSCGGGVSYQERVCRDPSRYL